MMKTVFFFVFNVSVLLLKYGFEILFTPLSITGCIELSNIFIVTPECATTLCQDICQSPVSLPNTNHIHPTQHSSFYLSGKLVSSSRLQCCHCTKVNKSTVCPDCVFTTVSGPALYYWSEVSAALSSGFKPVLAPHMERVRRTGAKSGCGQTRLPKVFIPAAGCPTYTAEIISVDTHSYSCVRQSARLLLLFSLRSW